MMQQWIARILLLPFALLYGLGAALHERFYRWGILKAVIFNIPTISVGNLTVGGAGKSPHVEYLIRLLKDYMEVGVLSRGYRRKSVGFKEVTPRMSVEESGDEPLQFKRKYPEAFIAVGENRSMGVPRMLMKHEGLEVILLDDAFQHRAIVPGLNILLTEHDRPFTRDMLLPVGRLREWPSAYRRADIIVVSKCPADPALVQREALLKEINPLPHQRVYFSYYDYLQPYFLLDPRYTAKLEEDWEALLICGIANADYLTQYLRKQVGFIKILEYEDHHYFSTSDISNLKKTYDNMETKKKIILTTEKDAMRLDLHRQFFDDNRMPVFVLPVEVRFHFEEDTPRFDDDVKDFLLHFKA
jgi:tetraacyldisaccharide 4'-kinase